MKRLNGFRKFATIVTTAFLAVLSFASLVPSIASAADNKLPNPLMVMPCPPLSTCRYYDELEKHLQTAQDTVIVAVIIAALNAMTYLTQQLAQYSANFLIQGGPGGLANYYKKDFLGFLKDAATDSMNNFIVEMNDYAKQATGFNLCTPFGLQAFDIQLSLGVGKIWSVKKTGCDFSQITKNFDTSVQSYQNADLLKAARYNLQTDRSEIGIGVKFHQRALLRQSEVLQAGQLNRGETGGLKFVRDLVTGNIKTPNEVFRQNLAELNAIKQQHNATQITMSALLGNAFKIGIYQLPTVFAGTFLNTLAVAGINAAKTALTGSGGSDDISTADLNNPYAQSSANGQRTRAVAFTDVLTPNLISTENQDFVHELSSCPTPRGLWGCSMDETFAAGLRAADQNGAFTVARAMGIGTEGRGLIFLHADWELVPESETKDNQDPGCYQRAYCASNLAKLRFARILPVGWELAANSPYNIKKGGRYVTLGDVVRGFNDCNPTKPVADKDHPWCHLIDPSWVLAAPQFQCRIKGYGDSVYAGTKPVRLQECSDVISCLTRDDKGQCVGGYGYCLSEKTVWRFGADSCLERFVSCRTYQTRAPSQITGGVIPIGANAGTQVSLLRNTIDYGSCNVENIGCMYYSTLRDVSTTSTERWVGTITAPTAVTGPKINGARIYLDASAEPCDASNEGCTKVLKINPGESALNLVKNGSFENTLTADATKLDAWALRPGSAYPTIGTSALLGAKDVEFIASGDLAQTVPVAPLRNYVASYYAKLGTGAVPANARLLMTFTKGDGTPIAAGKKYYRNFATCDASSDDALVTVTAKGLDSTWKRFTCEFVSTADTANVVLDVVGAGSVVDGVQLEEADAATAFIEGDSGKLTPDYLKLSPEELGCTGDPTKDRKECAKYARICLQAEAGCQGYTDIAGGDATEIPATLNPRDACPAQCVGYAEYRKLPSAFDLVKNPTTPLLDDSSDDTSAFFVPSAAGQCTAANVGCEEFTNIEAAAAGGETKANFKYIRACQKPDADSTTYFTWEGSDTTGYQLRTWSLVPDKSVVGAPPKVLLKAGPDGVVKSPTACTEAAWKSGADPDCRQFYNEKGDAFYRYFSQTIVSSPECRNYRKNNSSFNDCSKTGGTFNSTTNECVYSILATQSLTCPAEQTSCRAYIGTTGRNTVTVYAESFATTTSLGGFTAPAGVELTASAEALTVGDRSLRIARGPGGPGSLSATVSFAGAADTLYTISFWAKTTEAKDRTITLKSGATAVGTVTLGSDWGRFEVGPFTPGAAPLSKLSFENVPNTTYLDQITIRRLQDTVYVRKDTWVTPAICDQTAEGIPQPQAMLGCRAYADRAENVVNVRQFSRLCRYEKIGCSAFVDTRNSNDAYSQSFGLSGLTEPVPKPWDSLYAGTVTVVRPADRFIYVIDEPSAHCDDSMASCRAFGKPRFTADRMLQPTAATSSGFETVYFKDDITKYVTDTGEPNMLCRPSELFCDKFTSGPITSYFRDPGDQICEWRDKITIPDGVGYSAGDYSGWFVRGTTKPCYPSKLSTGNTFLSEYAAAAGYRGWTDTCPIEQSECTEFRDPNDNTDQLHSQGRPYFFINNQKLDKATCNGQVDLLSGCVLFRDMNDTRLLYSTVATYAKSNKESGNAQSPIDCISDPSNPYCQGRCGDFQRACRSESSCELSVDFAKTKTNALCSTDAECSRPLPAAEFGDPLGWSVAGKCLKNDANLVVKVKLDRDCSTWLGCSSGETVYDTAQGKYVDLCTSLAVCDQGLGANGKSFCAHYLDRKTNSTGATPPAYTFYEALLREGRFVDSLSYSSRATGFGVPDYSGYALPNHYQISDLVTRRVGYEILAGRPGALRDKYFSDYRVVARAPLNYGVRKTTTGGADDVSGVSPALRSPYGAIRFTDLKYPFLSLCQHTQTKQIGYYLTDPKAADPYAPVEKPAYCYFAIDIPYTQNPADIGGDGVTNPRNIQNLYVYFEQLADPKQNPQLTKAFPPAECKAYPDAGSPFPNVFVKEWDTVSDPAQPKVYAAGYENVNACELGEDCACSYRKISYGSTVKYYSPYGEAAPSGICVGGARDGQACVPDSVVDGSVATSSVQTKGESASNSAANQRCGEGGTCQAQQSVSLIRGMYGQCLQRDSARVVAGSQDYSSCLVWNPTPLLFGKNDVYHYQPTAGYLPPQNAGEYYCVASALPPKSITVPTASGKWLRAPGAMEDHKFHFDDAFVSDKGCLDILGIGGCSGNDAYFIDGVHAEGGAMGDWCEQADDDQDNNGRGADGTAARWIMTGRASGHSYAEYFIGIKPTTWANWIGGVTSGCDGDNPYECEDRKVLDAMTERNFSYFSWSPITNPNGNGRIGCGYSPLWAENAMPENFNSKDKTKPADAAWQQYFNANFGKVMSRESQDYLRTEDGLQLQKVPCTYRADNPDETGCYIKYWELGYRDAGESKFQMQWKDRGGPIQFGKNSIYYEDSQSSKPFFSIRAVFESGNEDDNKKDPADLPANGNRLTGPFRFIGWWVTASMPGTAEEHAIYMNLTIGHASICKEVAQVVSPDTRESAAYLDRIWEQAGYVVPRLGYTFSSLNEPFGSAKHTQPIGIDPLFQVRGPIPGVKSKLKPPTFIAAGLEYAKGGETPTANWAWLTNLFARVYRVYRYYDQPVGKDSWACIAGPKFGVWCPDLSGETDPAKAQAIAQRYCGYAGTCSGPVDPTRATGLCNALSGVNAGLSCSSDTSNPIDGYHVCHNAPMRQVAGELQPQYTGCEVQAAAGWELRGSRFFNSKESSTTGHSLKDARLIPASMGFGKPLRCQKGAVEESPGVPVECNAKTAPGDVSTDCPMQVVGTKYSKAGDGFIHSTCEANRCNNGFEHAQCKDDADCQFTLAQWWGAYNAEKKAAPPTKMVDSPLGPLETSAFDEASSGINIRPGYGGSLSGAVPWWSSNPGSSLQQFYPGTGDFQYVDAISGRSYPKPWLDIGGKDLYGSGYATVDDARLNRFPGAYAASVSPRAFIPAHCEKAPEDTEAMRKFIEAESDRDYRAYLADRPYAQRTFSQVGGPGGKAYTYVLGPGYQRYYGDDKQPWKQATCEGGALEGNACSNDSQCAPAGIGPLQNASKEYCRPVSATVGGVQTPNSGFVDSCVFSGSIWACVDNAERWNCSYPLGDPKSGSLDTDENLCTHNAGYYPRADLCGNDPSRPQCLTAVTQRDPASVNPFAAPPATDVTNGSYTPSYLASKITSEFSPAGIAAKDFPDAKYKYISYYTPRPPTIAAPDTSRQCPSSGSCPISKVNAFTLENRPEGTVTFTGGQAITTMRFYGWSTDNQGPIKDMWIDWGDGTSQEFHDVQVKNKKPFCGGTKECQFIPGLTCNVDADCPAAGGKCANVGFCKAKPNVQCETDNDCTGTSATKDRCVIRTTFGNSTEACEQNYFEYTHAYACGGEKRTSLPACGSAGFCGRNNAVSCGSDSDCGPTDKCLKSTALPGGCFDATKAACRFTPRILVKDNWGWCTGDCRVQTISGKLAGGFTGSGAENKILLQNGGCYDDTGIYKNTDSTKLFDSNATGANMCDPASASRLYSPWVVFQGALQLGITK